MEDMDDDTMPPDNQEVNQATEASNAPQRDKQLVTQIQRTIADDKRHHAAAFKRMRRDMQVAMWGAEKDWGPERYRANISGRHVKQKTAALYAKNPKVVAKRRETMDFAVWDENPDSLMMAYQTVQQAMIAQQTAAMMPPQFDPLTGQLSQPAPQMPAGLEQAQAVLQDFTQGMERRKQLDKLGKTLEILFNYSMTEQKPLDFKQSMKKVVRRASTTSVGYVKLDFQREYGPRVGLEDKLADFRARLDHLKRLASEAAEGEFDENDAEMAELEHAVAALQAEPEVLLREGLVFDFPQSTKVIPDKLTKSLFGFEGGRHLTIEYMFTADEVRERFGVDMENNYTSYTCNAGSSRDVSSNDVFDDDYEWSDPKEKQNDMVCVWEYFDKPSGLVYYVADGYPDFLQPPAAPNVFVEGFWPVFALTFNDVESEDELFPPSDVSLMLDMQKEHNRSRQGKREHRDAARPRWVYANGAFGSEDDAMRIRNLQPFEAVGLNIDTQVDIKRVLQTLPVPGVDPNLYDTNEVFADTQMVVGAQEAQFGGVSKATATETAIAAGSSNSADGSSIDDLDAFLTDIARAAGQIMLGEYSTEKVIAIVGPGAVWPDMTLGEIAGEVYLEIEAGSTGKPNQAVEVANMQRLLPLLMQIPGVQPMWLVKQVLRRMDDRMDLNDAVAEGIPSIISMNQQKQMAGPAGGTENDPNAQGPAGGQNSPVPSGPPGSMAPMGGNQTDPVAA